MEDFVDDHEIGFDLITAQHSDTEFFTIDVIGAVKADSGYLEGSDMSDVYFEARDGTIKVGGKTILEKRRETGADVVMIITIADDGGNSVGESSLIPVNETNYHLVHDGQTTHPTEDGETWLHELLHMLGVDKDGDTNCFQGGSATFCQAEIDAIKNANLGKLMDDYGETDATNNPPPQADISQECVGSNNWLITFDVTSNIYTAVLQQKYTGPWLTTWSGFGGTCVVRSGSFNYRAYFVDVFGNKGPYSTVISTFGSCGIPQ